MGGPGPDSYEGFIVHAFHRDRGSRTRLNLLGRSKDGSTFAVIDTKSKPGFYLRKSEKNRADAILHVSGTDCLPSAFRTLDGEDCWLIQCSTVMEQNRVHRQLIESGIRTYEGDIRFADQRLMSLEIHGSLTITGTFRKGRFVDRVFIDPELGPSDWRPEIAILSFDIETDRSGEHILMVSLVHADPWREQRVEEVLLVGDVGNVPSFSGYSDEGAMLRAFSERIRELDPDVLTGWNVSGFDIPVIVGVFERYGIPLNFSRSEEPARLIEGLQGGPQLIIPGRQVLDGVRLVRASPATFPDYGLDTVAKEVLGEGKNLPRIEGEDVVDAIERLYRNDPEMLGRYCLNDSTLVVDILEQTGLIELTLQRCLLTGIGLSRAWTSIAAFEHLYIENLHVKDLVAPSLGVDAEALSRSPGGAILSPQSGLYRNVLVFDFSSLYPSIIRTFNIDPLSRVTGQDRSSEGEVISAPNGAGFRREPGILPELLNRFFQKRTQAKNSQDEIASYVYKIIMNSFYGVLGASGCRFASSELAGAITSFGQLLLYWCRDYLVERDYRVLYGDTDSLFVSSGRPTETSSADLLETGYKLAQQINKDLKSYVETEFKVVSRLDLEFEKVYTHFFLPPLRGSASVEGGSRGRAKGYAGRLLSEDGSDDVEIKGMEAVRRDWTDLAQEFQRALLSLVFESRSPEELRQFIDETQKRLVSGDLDQKLVYRKALRKKIDEYTSHRPPHVKAAALLPAEKQRGVIRYIMTADGPQPAESKESAIDYDHYREKQLKPIAGSFAEVLGIELPYLFREDHQLTLF